MSKKKLIAVAKEFNIATTRVVEHLSEKGYEIINKPNAKVNEDMFQELLREFHADRDVRERANKMKRQEEAEESKKAEETKKAVESKKAEESKKVEKSEESSQDKKEEEKPEETIKAEVKEKPSLNVVGKIDLNKKAKQKEEPQTEEEKASKEKEEEPNEIIKAKAPDLSGPKVKGKIDVSKFEKKKKTKKTQEEEEKNKKKRKRRRRRVVVSDKKDSRRSRSRGRKKQEEERKEVTAKEIEEKIKATKARIYSGGKSKRQKIRRDSRDKQKEKQDQATPEEENKLQLTEFISVSDLASLMDVPVNKVITTCMNLGVIVSINQRLDAEIIELLTEEFGYEVEFISAEEQAMDIMEEEEDAPEDLESRAPIVTVMGHVDHGKTSLLDYIRKTNVTKGEAGGITQHIGAYEVKLNEDKSITFLDTPGHEAFTAMRARGTKVTDVAVIIVSADDNVMPQTKEAISHAQAAGVPIIFAINKIDKPGADPERIKQELANMNLLVEDWGGKIQSQDISAMTGENVDQLLEKIILEAELLDLKANPEKEASGTVVEASLDKGRGYVTKLLVHGGTLKVGDPLVAGEYSGKVKAMFNEKGQRVKSAGPSQPVLVLGLDGAPTAGEPFKVMDDEPTARQIAAKRGQINREQTNRAAKRINLGEIGRRLALGDFKELNLIVKGDVDGSVEALSDSLIKLSQETVQVNVIHKAVGQIVESDVLLATASEAIVIGFQVRPSMGARNLAEKEGVEIKTYSIIYEAIEEIKAAIEGMLEPTKEEKVVGQVEIREIFKISRVGTIAGCFVLEGKIHRNNNVRVIRDGIVIYPIKEGVEGEIDSLKRYKDDVKEVRSGMECGLSVKNFNDIKVGDQIEAYETIEIKQTLQE